MVVQFVRVSNAVELATHKDRRKEGHRSVTVIRLAHTILDDLRGDIQKCGQPLPL